MGEEEEKEDQQQQHEEGSPKSSDDDNGNGNGKGNKKSGGGGGGNNNGQKKKGGGGGGGGAGEEKKSITIVLRSDFHCLGCSIRLKKSILAFPGVDIVKEGEENKVTVIGTGIDPVKLRDSVEKKMKRKVELVFPQPPKNGGGGGNKNNGADGGDKKAEEKQQDNNNKKAKKEPPVTTVVLKVAYHCLGCGQKIHKIVSTFKGVHTVTVDKDKDQVTVKGTMDAKILVECLKEKLRRPVEIIPEKKDNKDKNKESGTGDEKGNNQGGNAGNGGGGGGKKKGGGNGGGGSGGGGDDNENGGNGKNDGGAAANKLEYMVQGTGYVCREASSGYVVDILHAPQWFSEEKANGCVVM